MGEIRRVLPVKYFIAVTFQKHFEIDNFLQNTFTDLFGNSDLRSENFNFSRFTNYYAQEMGEELSKFIISLESLYPPDKLPRMKLQTNQLEKSFMHEGNRLINLDPGYVTLAKVVLATTKDYSHRIYLSDGIYGDLHLYYANKSFQKQSWTYPDYQQAHAVVFFNQLRAIYSQQLSGARIE